MPANFLFFFSVLIKLHQCVTNIHYSFTGWWKLADRWLDKMKLRFDQPLSGAEALSWFSLVKKLPKKKKDNLPSRTWLHEAVCAPINHCYGNKQNHANSVFLYFKGFRSHQVMQMMHAIMVGPNNLTPKILNIKIQMGCINVIY